MTGLSGRFAAMPLGGVGGFSLGADGMLLGAVERGRVKPNNRSAPGPIANTQGLIVPQTSINPDGDSAPAPQPPAEEEGWWKSWGSTLVHGVLDVVGLIPVVGEAANLIGAGIYALEGDYESAAADLLAMIPVGGQAATAAKYARKATKAATKAAAKKAAKKAVARGGKGKGKRGGKVKGKGRCVLRPYRPDTCAPLTGHHVVADRAFRVGKRGSARIPGGIAEKNGLVICVEGKNASRSTQHGRIHRIYDRLERVAGLAGDPVGSASLGMLEVIGAYSAGKATGCNPLWLWAQLRAYHHLNGLGLRTKVRADPGGKLPVDASRLGTGATPGGNVSR